MELETSRMHCWPQYLRNFDLVVAVMTPFMRGGSSPGDDADAPDSAASRRPPDRPTDAGRPSRRRLLGAAATGLLSSSIAGCLDTVDVVGGDATTDEITIGVLYGGTGAAQTVAAEIAAAEITEAGGLLGRDVTVVSQETKSSPTEARRGYHRLTLQEGVDVTMGLSTTNVLAYLLEDIAEQETLHFTTGVGSVTPSERIAADYERYKYHFRTGPINNVHQIENQLAFLGEMAARQGWESVGILTEDYPWADSIIPTFEEHLPRLGLEVAHSRRYRPSRSDFGPVYDEFEDAGIDVLWVGMGHTGTDAVVQWARQRRPFEFGGTHVTLQLPDYYDDLNGAPRYTFTQTAATPESELTSLTQGFVDSYRSATGGSDPIYTSYHMYDSVRAYAAAVEDAGTLDPDAVVASLESLDIEGTTGSIEYYGEGADYPHDRVYDDESSGSVFFQWQENDETGVQEIVWPTEYATGEYESPPWV